MNLPENLSEDVRLDWEWSERSVPAIKAIIGAHLVNKASLERDMKQATDLIIFKSDNIRIAARARRAKGDYAKRYPWQFTLRCWRASGAETELSKIERGWCDWFFYGHQLENTDQFSRWFLINLDEYRIDRIADLDREFKRHPDENHPVKNRDFKTAFIAIDVRALYAARPKAIIASSHPIDPWRGDLIPRLGIRLRPPDRAGDTG